MPSMLVLLASLAPAVAAQTGDTADWQDVSAILQKHCVNCHSYQGASKGLRLDSYATTLRGSEKGAVVVARDPAASEMIRRLRGQSTPRMPFLGRPLPEAEIALIVRWIEAGLPNVHGTDE